MKKILISGILLLGVMSLFVARRGQAESPTDDATDPGAGKITVLAAGRGKPRINLSDGRTLRQTFAGAESLVQTLVDHAATPRSLATADFDEDGTPDLVSGYGKDSGGILTFARGNVDAVYPNAPEAKRRQAEGTFTDSPFLAETRIFAAPETVDFLGAGDFDADGHWDLVGAARGSRSLFWVAGDGSGNFSSASLVELRGSVTALTVGEINRADGLNEVVVGIDGADGARVLVFEHPTGALRGEPEVFESPASPTSLALGQFDQDPNFDLAVGGGSKLLFISGRDRKLSHLSGVRERVPAAGNQTLEFPFEIDAIAAGNFIAQNNFQTEIALLSKDNHVHFLQREVESQDHKDARTAIVWKERGLIDLPNTNSSSLGLFVTSNVAISSTESLLVNTGDKQLHIVTSENRDSEKDPGSFSLTFSHTSLTAESRPVAALPMRLNVDALSDLVVLTENLSAPSIVRTELVLAGVVTNTDDSGPGSLRQAMLGAGLITFNIPGNGPHTINLASPLPTPPVGFVTPHTIDGTTQPGFNGSPLIVVNGAALPSGANALTLMSDVSLVRGLAIVNSPTAIYITSIQAFGFNFVEGNYLGVMPNGTTAAPNTYSVRIERADNNTIGGTTVAARNVIVSTGISIDVSGANLATSTGNLIRGNYIGTNAAGTAGLNPVDGAGIRLLSYARETTIGGTLPGSRNLISSINTGISISETNNLVQGNYIGTDASGTYSIFNNSGGIIVGGGSSNSIVIGGTTPAARNIISGNRGAGIILGQVDPDTGDLVVQGNWIGVSAAGLPLPNGGGINLFMTNALVGGTVAGAGNLIAYNRYSGISNTPSALRVAIIGNSIHSNTPDPSNSQGAGLGIDLVLNQGPFGVTPNDLNDPDTGPNDLQNFPVITSATSANGSTNIVGSLNSRTDGVFTQFRIEFFSNPSCDPSGHGEGKTYLGATEFNEISTVFNFNFNVSLPLSVPGGSFITATATRNFLEVVQDNAMTSEFSQCFQTTAGSRAHRVTDFSGNGTSDLALFRPSSGDWFIRETVSAPIQTTHFGATGDIPQPADFDGDGSTDIAVYRPSIGVWFVLRSSDGNVSSTPFGLAEDKPVAADYDGDGRAELAVYRPSTGVWWMFNLTTSSVGSRTWGLAEDKPVPQDYDGDGRADVAVFRPSNGTWYIVNSNDNTFRFVQWGVSEDKPVAGDYDGDGRADVAVWRPSSGVWYALRSTNNSMLAVQWGTSGDVPQPGDYDGDFRNDYIVWRPSNTTWYVFPNVGGPFLISTFGATSDIPEASPYRIE